MEHILDNIGRTVRLIHHGKDGPSETLYAYNDKEGTTAVPARITNVSDGRIIGLAALRIFDSPQDHLFERDEIVRKVALTNLEFQRAVDRMGAPTKQPGIAETGKAGSALPDEARRQSEVRASEPYNPAARYRTPLVLAGVFVFGLAAFAWWRQRA